MIPQTGLTTNRSGVGVDEPDGSSTISLAILNAWQRSLYLPRRPSSGIQHGTAAYRRVDLEWTNQSGWFAFFSAEDGNFGLRRIHRRSPDVRSSPNKGMTSRGSSH